MIIFSILVILVFFGFFGVFCNFCALGYLWPFLVISVIVDQYFGHSDLFGHFWFFGHFFSFWFLKGVLGPHAPTINIEIRGVGGTQQHDKHTKLRISHCCGRCCCTVCINL